MPLSGGASTKDMIVINYTPEEAEAILAEYTPEQREEFRRLADVFLENLPGSRQSVSHEGPKGSAPVGDVSS